ncbi:MAG: D-aspartate ligase [Planctomycetota bacterium]|jgi:D-aspartate ligase
MTGAQNEMKRLLILDSRTSPMLTMRVVQCLAATKRFQLHVATPLRKSSQRHSRWVEQVHFVPDHNGFLNSLGEIANLTSTHQCDLVLPVNVDTIEMVISPEAEAFRQRVRLPALADPATFKVACSKYELTAFMEEKGIPHPKTVRIDPSRPESISEAEAMPLPVIVKPTFGGGGRGVRIVREPRKLRSLLESGSTHENRLIVQEFIPGYDVGCAAYCEAGTVIALTMQRDMGVDPNSVEPSKGLCFIDDPAVRSIAQQLLGELGWDGVAQIDFRVDAVTGAVTVLEINPRYWGSVLGSQRMGINFPALAVSRALNLDLPDPTYILGKYITARGLLSYWKDRLLGKKGLEHFRLTESDLKEMVVDPLMTMSHTWQEVMKRVP